MKATAMLNSLRQTRHLNHRGQTYVTTTVNPGNTDYQILQVDINNQFTLRKVTTLLEPWQ